jgi:hypothetical protein
VIAGVVCVAALGAARAVPPALERWQLSPDSVEHVAIAQSLVHGSGFVDPVQWGYYLPDNPPLPAFAIRAPVVPLLLALPLALGATLTQVIALHAVFASLLVAACVPVAARWMRFPAALGVGIGLASSPSWAGVASRPLTEATSLGALLLVLGSVGGVLRSPSLALACSGWTLVAWCTRPNLGLIAPAVALAAVWQLGPRAALRCRPLWSYLIGFLVLQQLTVHFVRLLTGHAPYSGYGFLLEVLRVPDVRQYQLRYAGPWSFIGTHVSEILEHIGSNAAQLVHVLFLDPGFLRVGWLLPLALVLSLRDRSPASFEARSCLTVAFGLSLVAIGNYAIFDGRRFPLPIAILLWFVGMWALDRIAVLLAERGGGRRRSWWAAAPLAVAAALVLPTLAPTLARDARALVATPTTGSTIERYGDWDPTARRWCGRLERDAVVASPSPWPFLLWCGNAGLRLPSDLTSQAWLTRFLDEKRPRYLVAGGARYESLFAHSPRLVLRAREGRRRLYEVVGAPRGGPWRAPPPLACAGKGVGCLQPIGRPPQGPESRDGPAIDGESHPADGPSRLPSRRGG